MRKDKLFASKYDENNRCNLFKLTKAYVWIILFRTKMAIFMRNTGQITCKMSSKYVHFVPILIIWFSLAPTARDGRYVEQTCLWGGQPHFEMWQQLQSLKNIRILFSILKLLRDEIKTSYSVSRSLFGVVCVGSIVTCTFPLAGYEDFCEVYRAGGCCIGRCAYCLGVCSRAY